MCCRSHTGQRSPYIFQLVGQNSDARISKNDLITTLYHARNMVPRRVVVLDIPSFVVSASAIEAISNLAKEISNFVPSIVVLASVGEFPDRSRIEYQLVEEMTESKADEVLFKLWNEEMAAQPLLPHMTTSTVRFITVKQGRSPQDLNSLVKQVTRQYIGSLTSIPSLQEVVRQQVEVNINMALQDLYRYPRAYNPLLRAWKRSPSGAAFPIIDHVAWARDAEQAYNHAILYDMENATFKLQKALYKTAIQQYE